jgi:hypothetical protein
MENTCNTSKCNRFFERALSIREEVLGKEAYHTWETRLTLGELYTKQGLREKTMSIMRAYIGPGCHGPPRELIHASPFLDKQVDASICADGLRRIEREAHHLQFEGKKGMEGKKKQAALLAALEDR